MLLASKVAIVTGAARGQGASHARHLPAPGARVLLTDVLLTDVLDDAGKAVAEELRAAGRDVDYAHLDVRDSEQWTGAVSDVVARWGSVDVLVSSGGVCELSELHECPDDEWAYVMNTNAGGVFRGCRAVVPTMRTSGGGAIVNTASVQAVKGSWGYVAYQASKAAVVGITRSAAITYAIHNIRVNAVAPSAVDTPMLAKELEHFSTNPHVDVDQWVAAQPIRRVAQPEEVSMMVVFLASDLSSFSTGGIFPVDGGLLA
jgi:3alpha(or 20beta)-hydroxysteroid dehydrogenase